jgi:hypothetical protein
VRRAPLLPWILTRFWKERRWLLRRYRACLPFAEMRARYCSQPSDTAEPVPWCTERLVPQRVSSHPRGERRRLHLGNIAVEVRPPRRSMVR